MADPRLDHLNITKGQLSVSANKITFTAKYRRNYVAHLAVLLFFLIIAGEILLATAIPTAMRNEELMADQAARNDLLMLFDTTRINCAKISGKNANQQEDSLILLEKQLLTDAIDRFARYIREEGERLTPDEVVKIRSVLIEFNMVAARLAQGKSYSQENRLNTSEYINNLLKQNNGGSLHAKN